MSARQKSREKKREGKGGVGWGGRMLNRVFFFLLFSITATLVLAEEPGNKTSTAVATTNSTIPISQLATQTSSQQITQTSPQGTSQQQATQSSPQLTQTTPQLTSTFSRITTTRGIPNSNDYWTPKVTPPSYDIDDQALRGTTRWQVPYTKPIKGLPNVTIEYYNTNGTKISPSSKLCNTYYDKSDRTHSPFGYGFGFWGGYEPRHPGPNECECYQYRSCSFAIQMTPETNYVVTLRKGTDNTTWSTRVTTKSGIPPRMPDVFKLRPAEENKDTTFPIYIDTTNFRHSHGIIRKYQLSLARNRFLEASRYGWIKDMVDQRSLPIYNLSDALYRVYENFSTDVREFTIGTAVNDTDQDSNRPLKPDTWYKLKIRVFTTDGYRDIKVYSFRTAQTPGLAPGIVMSIALPVVVMVLIVMALVIKKLVTPAPMALEKAVSVDLSWMLTTEELMRGQKPIHLSVLTNSITNLFANDRAVLIQEFAELGAISPESVARVAAQPANVPKNRYVNILPYDESRVILRKFRYFQHSDYINASYVHGYKRAKQFIAAQGPLQTTTQDFWRMVWEKNVACIVMLTCCVQAGQDKCHQYWGEVGETKLFTYEGLSVRTVRETLNPAAGYTLRNIVVAKKGARSHEVNQFHYVAWPDMGCPESPDLMLGFLKIIRSSQHQQTAPMVVHCSAGVGRTGTFIALYNLLNQMEATDFVDVFNCVLRLRCHRPNMVQTLDQYAFIYRSVCQLYKDGGERHSEELIPNIPPRPCMHTGLESGYTSASDSDRSEARYLRHVMPGNFPDPWPYPPGFGDPDPKN